MNPEVENLIKKEYNICKKEPFPSLGISIGLNQNNYFKWDVILSAPDDSIYKGGFFKMSIEFSNDFPKSKPIVKFKTKIIHCNVSDEGDIDIPSLNHWKENYSMSMVLSDVFSLFYEQKADKPNINKIHNDYMYNINDFKNQVKESVNKYASFA